MVLYLEAFWSSVSRGGLRSKICQIKIKCDDSGNANNSSDVKRWLLLLHHLIIKAFGNKSIMSRSQMPTKSSSYQYSSIWILYTSLSTVAILRCCLQFLSVPLTLFKHFFVILPISLILLCLEHVTKSV